MNINAAQSLLERDPELAVKFAERSLQGSITPSFLTFLLKARKTNSTSADSLFLQSLAHLNQDPMADVRDVHALGNYLFTAPNLLESDALAVTRVGDLMLPNIATQRPDVPVSLVRDYLRTAGVVLWRSASDPAQKPYGYALAYLLLPKAKGVAPDLASPIESAMAAMVADVAPNLADDTAYKYINALPANAADRFDSAEKQPDQESREIAYLDLANWAWRKGDFQTARIANGRIANQELAGKVGVLIDFGEGAWSIKRDPKRVGQASAYARKLPHGIEEAILYLAIARSRTQLGQTVQAEEAVDSALKASRSVTDARRGFLILMAAAELADLKSPATQYVLPQAIKELNSFDETAYASLDWSENVEAGQLKSSFPLEVGNVDFSFSRAFHRAIAADLGSAITRAEELKGENLRAQGFVEVASALVERLPKTGVQDEPIVVVGEDGIRKAAVKTVMPLYPEEALKKRQQGTVVVELQYDSKGDVTSVSSLEAPAGSIGGAVAQAVKRWKFTNSKTADGRAINIRGKLTFYFEIDKAGKGVVNNPKQYR
jgi:TonB family protein